jgi:hypothetical protein
MGLVDKCVFISPRIERLHFGRKQGGENPKMDKILRITYQFHFKLQNFAFIATVSERLSSRSSDFPLYDRMTFRRNKLQA